MLQCDKYISTWNIKSTKLHNNIIFLGLKSGPYDDMKKKFKIQNINIKFFKNSQNWIS